MNSQDVLIEGASAKLLEQLRKLDNEMAALGSKSRALLEGYVAAKDWNQETHNVSLDLNSGMFTVTPKAPGPNAESVDAQKSAPGAAPVAEPATDAAGTGANGNDPIEPEPAIQAPAVNT